MLAWIRKAVAYPNRESWKVYFFLACKSDDVISSKNNHEYDLKEITYLVGSMSWWIKTFQSAKSSWWLSKWKIFFGLLLIFFLAFDSDDAIPQKATKNEFITLNILQLLAIDSFLGVKFLQANIFVFCVKLHLLQLILPSFFYNQYLHFFLFIKLSMIFWDFCFSGLPKLWQALIMLPSTWTWISAKTNISNSSNLTSKTGPGFPLRVVLFRWPKDFDQTHTLHIFSPTTHTYILLIFIMEIPDDNFLEVNDFIFECVNINCIDLHILHLIFIIHMISPSFCWWVL